MKQLLLAAFVLTGLALAAGARAQPTEQTFTVKTTGDLAELCGDTTPANSLMTTAAQNFCHGYLLGAYEVLAQINAARGRPDFCIPSPSPSENEAIAEFVSWARANPTDATRPPADGVYEFLTQHFPCPARQ